MQESTDQASHLMSYVKSLHSKSTATSIHRLELRGGEFLQFVISTRISTHFHHFFTETERIIQVQQRIWGLVSPFFQLMLDQLTYIASDDLIPDPLDTKSPQFRASLFAAVTSKASNRYTSPQVLDTLVQIADEQFNEHLVDLISQVGTDSEEFAQAHRQYVKGVISKFSSALTAPELADLPPRDRSVLALAQTKLKLILYHHSVWKAEGAPQIDGKVPLFSPMCVSSMIDDWSSLDKILFIVSPYPSRTRQ